MSGDIFDFSADTTQLNRGEEQSKIRDYLWLENRRVNVWKVEIKSVTIEVELEEFIIVIYGLF